MTTTTPYTITWAAFVPVKGIVTKKDNAIIAGFHSTRQRDSACCFHSATKDLALQRIDGLKGKLSKEYKVFIFTDKQFGLANTNDGDILISSLGHRVKLTEKQKADMRLIK